MKALKEKINFMFVLSIAFLFFGCGTQGNHTSNLKDFPSGPPAGYPVRGDVDLSHQNYERLTESGLGSVSLNFKSDNDVSVRFQVLGDSDNLSGEYNIFSRRRGRGADGSLVIWAGDNIIRLQVFVDGSHQKIWVGKVECTNNDRLCTLVKSIMQSKWYDRERPRPSIQPVRPLF